MKIKFESIKIKSRYIYGDIREKNKANSVIIFLSGFSGGLESSLFKESSKFFFNNGFSTLRLNFCADNDERQRKNAIRLEEMNFSVYMDELKHIFSILEGRYEKFILVGHSFGAVIFILFLHKNKKYRKNTTLILWEPSLLPWKKKWMEEDFTFDKKRNLYCSKHAKEFINKIFYRECVNIEDTTKTFQSLGKQAYIIATTQMGEKNAKVYFSKIRDKAGSKLLIMNGTEHSFEGKRYRDKLFKISIDYVFS